MGCTQVRLVVGGYRGRTHIDTCMASIRDHVTGITDVVLIDDSNNRDHTNHWSQYGTVIEGHGRGYAHTMQLACTVMAGDYTLFVEEDFQFIADVDLKELTDILDTERDLARSPYSETRSTTTRPMVSSKDSRCAGNDSKRSASTG